MVYEWEQHKDLCYNLYIQERKSLEEIMQYMKDTYNFNPSKRAFQTQFKRWDFPSKQNPAHKNADLVARVKELWENNLSQRDMLTTLNQEGFEIKDRELIRVRAKNRWLLRVPNGMKANVDEMQQQAQDLSQDEFDAFQRQVMEAAGMPTPTPRKPMDPPPLSEDAIRKRKERHEEMIQESDAKWAAKKRRRRTKGWAGLPADPPGPPRFPSETTLEESKVFLELDNEGYKAAREQFQSICEEAGVIKKTTAGPDKWAAVKDQFVRENADLQQAFWNQTANTTEAKSLALDVICTDVTKRMRTIERRMTIADAKKALGINPEQSRQIRNSFYAILRDDHFSSKLAAGDEHWKDLREKWMAGQPMLQEILGQESEGDPRHQIKVKAIEVLCRDVMKRLRDDNNRRDSGHPGPAEIPEALEATSVTTAPMVNRQRPSTRNANRNPAGTNSETASAMAAVASIANSSLELSDLQIDPSLLEAAGQEFELPPFMPMPTIAPTAFYVRPHPQSELHRNEKMWLGTLTTRSVGELQRLIVAKWPDAITVRIDGIEKPPGQASEMKYLIEEDEELDAYLTHVRDRKAVFVAFLRRPGST